MSSRTTASSKKTPAPNQRDVAAERTRAALMRAGRKLFTAPGHAQVSVQDLARAAKVTTGAIYHHFQSKDGLFVAVAQEVSQEVTQRAAAAMETRVDPWERFLAALDAVLDACLLPHVRAVYNQAPAVMGLDAWRALEERQSDQLMRGALLTLMELKVLPVWDAAILVPMAKGAIIEAAMGITRSAAPQLARPEAGAALHAMFTGLRQRRPASGKASAASTRLNRP